MAVIVCRDLPFEERYFGWIAFAPTKSHNWRKLITTLVRTGNHWELLKLIEGMRPKEVRKIMDETFKEMAKEGTLPPEYEAQMERNRAIVTEYVLTRMAKRLPPEQFARIFGVKDLLAGLPAEERLASIPVEERLASIPVEERLAGIPAEERLAGLSQEEKQKLLKTLLEQNGNTEDKV